LYRDDSYYAPCCLSLRPRPAGGFDLRAAEAVCTGEDLPAGTVVNVVHGLVEKSVLARYEHGGRARYRMLEIIREYGHERLAER
jgi:predicted ATPase